MEQGRNDALLDMFIFESNQLTEQLESILLEVEENQEINTESINEIFRIMHTVKGSAAMMAEEGITTISHELEDLFFYIREEKVDVDVDLVCDIGFKVIDFIRIRIVEIGIGVKEDENEARNAEFIEFVKREVKKLRNTSAKESSSDKKSYNYYKATVFFDNMCDMVIARSFMIANRLELLFGGTNYSLDLDDEDALSQNIMINGFEISFYTDLDVYEIKDMLEEINDVRAVVVESLNEEEQIDVETDFPSLDEQKQIARGGNNTIKQGILSVSVGKLDKLIDIVGEIVMTEAMVVKNPELEGLTLDGFDKAARQLQKLTDELQDLVLSIRMIPVEVLFAKMFRLVRDMGKSLNKDTELVILGEETEIDKNVMDHLSDPLMHLIRNCMDHGIEESELREKRGKPKIGRVTLEAKNTGGDVFITVSDDGGGLNKERILEKASANGLISADSGELSDKEIYNFILLPGFSTKEEVTEYSGRGVGMDVVRENIQSIQGQIDVDSIPEKGTTFTIRIPLTLAIIDGMMVKVGESIFIIPTQSIIQSFRTEKGDVFSDVDSNEMIIIRDECIPVMRLHTLYNVETDVTEYSEGILVMTECNGKKVCLFGDQLLGEQTVVVKTLPAYLTQFKLNNLGIGSCTILGDGTISPILDIASILNHTKI